jgi:hypothetical protein
MNIFSLIRILSTGVGILALIGIIFPNLTAMEIVLYWLIFNVLTVMLESYLLHLSIVNEISKIREDVIRDVIRDGNIKLHLNSEITYKPLGHPIAKLGNVDIFEKIKILTSEEHITKSGEIYEYIGVVHKQANVNDQISQILKTNTYKEVISFSNGLIYGIPNPIGMQNPIKEN